MFDYNTRLKTKSQRDYKSLKDGTGYPKTGDTPFAMHKERIVPSTFWIIRKRLRQIFDGISKFKFTFLANILIEILKIFISIFTLAIVLFSVGVLTYDDRIMLNVSFKINKDLMTQLVISQMNITFLYIAIVSLIAGMDKKYIIGEKVIGKAILGRFGIFLWMYFILFALMIINFCIVISDERIFDLIVVISIAISFILFFWMIYRVLKILFQENAVKRYLFYTYYQKIKREYGEHKTLEKVNFQAMQLIHDGSYQELYDYFDLYIFLLENYSYDRKTLISKEEYISSKLSELLYFTLNKDPIWFMHIFFSFIENANHKYLYLSSLGLSFYRQYYMLITSFDIIENSQELVYQLKHVAIQSKQLTMQWLRWSMYDRGEKCNLPIEYMSLIYNAAQVNKGLNDQAKNTICEEIIGAFDFRPLTNECGLNNHLFTPLSHLLLCLLYHCDERSFKFFLSQDIPLIHMNILYVILTLLMIKTEPSVNDSFFDCDKFDFDVISRIFYDNTNMLTELLKKIDIYQNIYVDEHPLFHYNCLLRDTAIYYILSSVNQSTDFEFDIDLYYLDEINKLLPL